MATYLRPAALDEALEALAAAPLVVLAGGTDHYPARVGRPNDDDILDITALDALNGIEERDDHWRIGALTRWSTVRDGDLPPWFDALRLAAREVGGRQVQNAGTIGGNLCNASPAADGIPPLLTLDAEVELAGRDGSELLSLDRFILGNRQTARRPDQLLTAISVPKPATARAGSHFLKLGARRHLVISIVMTAAALEVDERGVIRRARLAIGACSPVARRLPDAEAALGGVPVDGDPAARIDRAHLRVLAPIDDVRADAVYRQDAALVLLRRTVAELAATL
ncbi:MAG: FAD binding domain-containing protein [Geminicoccaceae bacterium]|nr:FAD binding domain-containing protein [Geminicoccaceae bacterium]